MPGKKSRNSARKYKKKRNSRRSGGRRRSYRKRRSATAPKRGFAARARGLVSAADNASYTGYSAAEARRLREMNKPLGLPTVNPWNLPLKSKLDESPMPYSTTVPASFLDNYRIKGVGQEYWNPDFQKLQFNTSRLMPKPALRSLWASGANKHQPLLDARYCGKGTLALGTDKGVWESTGSGWKPCKGGAANCYNPGKICGFYGNQVRYNAPAGPAIGVNPPGQGAYGSWLDAQ